MPVYATLPADIITPVIAYLRLTEGAQSGHGNGSFLLESVLEGAYQARYSFVGASRSHLERSRWLSEVHGADPRKVLKTGEKLDRKGDPLIYLEQELQDYRFIELPGVPSFTGLYFTKTFSMI